MADTNKSMEMTLTTPLDRGFTIYPFMFIPKRLKKGTPEYEAYVSHETIHYIRQGILMPIWIIKYFFDDAFRWQEERLAYTAEIEYLKVAGAQIDEDFYSEALSTQYWGMVNKLTAKKFIKELLE